MKPAKDAENGSGEIIGALMLILIFVAAFAVLGAIFFSQTPKEEIPQLNLAIASQGNAITVSHAGGDPLPGGEYYVLVDGVPQTFTGAASDNTWSIGQTLSYIPPPGTTPQKVDVVYVSPSGEKYLIATQTLGPGPNVNPTTQPVPMYTIMASAGANGAINPAGAVSVYYGASQNFTITPNTGCYITDVLVNGATVGPVTSYVFSNVQSNQTISTTFAISTYTITASTGVNGNVTPAGATSVNYGSNQTYTITPATGYHVADVLIDGSSVGNVTTYQFTNVVAAHTISATFAINTYTITASTGANGNVTPAGITTVNYGSNQTYTITPVTGYHVADVLVDGSSVGNVTTYSFASIAASHTISATFAINTYTITATSGANGAVTPTGVTTVNYGDNQTYTITPNTGYHVVNVTVDGSSVGNVTTYSFASIAASHTISATFAINTYTITANTGANGNVTPAGVTTVNYGSSKTYTITPVTGYHVADVLVDGSSVGNVTTYSFTSIAASHT
ncbi:MAG: type IV pilin, partial [Methanoregula sp.]|nr:type IV pilin [Methanoregula sp.]